MEAKEVQVGEGVAHVVGSGEGKADEGGLLKRGRELPLVGGPNEKPKNQNQRKGATDMSTPHITRWIGIGLLGLPAYVPVDASGLEKGSVSAW